MNSAAAGAKGGARGMASDDPIRLRAEIRRMEDLLNDEKRFRKDDQQVFAQKLADYDNVIEKKEAAMQQMKRKIQDFEGMKVSFKEQSAKLEKLRKTVKDSQANVTQGCDTIKNLEDTIKSMQLASKKREADLLERESELAKIKTDHANLAEKSTQQESELCNLKADNANLLEKVVQQDLRFGQLQAENEKLSKASASQASELAKFKNFMATLSAQTASLSSAFSAQSDAGHVCRSSDGEARSVKTTQATSGAQMEGNEANATMAASENPVNEPVDDFQSKNAQVEASSKSDEDEKFIESAESKTEKVTTGVDADPPLEVAPSNAVAVTEENKVSEDTPAKQDAMIAAVVDDPLPDVAAPDASESDLVVLDECKIPIISNQRAAAGGSSAEETLSFDGAEDEDVADSALGDGSPAKSDEECNEIMNELSLGSNYTKSPAGDEKEKKNNNGNDDCNSMAPFGRDSKSEAARSSNTGSASSYATSSTRSGSSISSSDNSGDSTITVESDDSQRKQRKRKSVSHKHSSSSAKRSRPCTTTPSTAKSNLNSEESGTTSSSTAKKSKRSESGSSAAGRNKKRKSRSGTPSKGKGDRFRRPRSPEAKQRRNNSPIGQRPANRRPPWVPIPPGEPVQNFYQRQQFQQPLPLLGVNLRGGGGQHFRGSYGGGGRYQQQRSPHRGGWQQGRHNFHAKPENGRGPEPNRYHQNR